MSWHIKVEHVDDQTGESVVCRAIVSDEKVEYSSLEVLKPEFDKIVSAINAHLKGEK